MACRKQPPKKFSQSSHEWAWAAGFFDGEGNIHFGKRHTLHMSITQKERQPLERLQQVFGCGSFYFHPKNCWVLTLSAISEVEHVCDRMWPYLSEPKRLQIKGALESHAEIIGHGYERFSKTHCKHGHAFTPANTYIDPTGTKRICVICRTAAAERYRQRKVISL